MIALAVSLVLAQVPITLQCDGIADLSRQEVARATVEINGEAVRVRAPSGMFATIAGDRQDFWRDLRDVVITDREISGSMKPNLVSRLIVVIDRMSGEIRINYNDPLGGSTAFVGDCVVVSATPLF